MPLPATLAARFGRMDAAYGPSPTGTSVDNSVNSNPIGIGGSISVGVGIGSGRDSLLLLALLVVGIAAFSYWTR